MTKRVQEQFLSEIRQTSGAPGETAMRQVMHQHDILALWEKQSKADGLKPGDLADAFATKAIVGARLTRAGLRIAAYLNALPET